MRPAGAVLLHGYGVRSYIWTPFREAAGSTLGTIALADIDAESLSDLITRAKARVRRHSLECDAPVLVVGHSLGGVLAAISARDLGPEVVSAVVMLAPPYGERRRVPGKLLQFLLRHRLIPPFLLRPRFFTAHTPRGVQRAVFKAAVPEAPAIQALTFEPRWFHTELLTEKLAQPSLVIASEADRVVPHEQSKVLAEVIGARFHLFPEAMNVGHDDLFASPRIVSEVMTALVKFLDAV